MNNYKPVYVYPLKESDGWMKLTGELPVKMTNDYLFRALLQSDNEVLKALLASLLKMKVGEIRSAEVTNPILLGESISEKTYIMDVRVVLNDEVVINLEMQVIRESGWEDRSVLYTCRIFDRLNRGSAYDNARPVRQIAFCDFTLFKDYPEFYSTYRLINEKNPKVVYTEKFVISNVDLTRIDLATEEDKKYGLDQWCRLFKARSWEDMKTLAKENEVMSRAISGVWQLTEDERIREECLAREEWIANDNWKNETIAKQNETIAQLKDAVKQNGVIIEKLEAALKQQEATMKQQETKMKQQEAKMKQLNDKLEDKDKIIEELGRSMS